MMKWSRLRSALRNDEFRASRALAVPARHQNDNDANRLAALGGRAGLGQSSAILRRNLLADRIAIGGNPYYRPLQ